MKHEVKNWRISREAGFALPAVIILIGMIAVVAVYMINRTTTSSKQSTYANGTYQAANIIKQTVSLIEDNVAWGHTLWSNASMACLAKTPNLDCYATYGSNGSTVTTTNWPSSLTVAQGAFALYDRAGNLFYDSTVATNGFDYNGQPCPYSASNSYSNSANAKTYGDATGQCPFHLVLYWVPHCPSGSPCTSTMDYYTIKGYLLFTPVNNNEYKMPYKIANYTINIQKSTSTVTVSNYCCAIECKHLTGDGPGTANAVKTIVTSSNCYPGSSEIASSICADTFSADPNDWAFDGTTAYSAGSCAFN